MLKIRHINLKMIFQYFCNIDQQSQIHKQYITIKDFKHVFVAFGLTLVSKSYSPNVNEISEKELAVIFNQSMMTSMDELNYDRHTKMVLIEFQEALARLADKVNPINAHEDALDFSL